MFDSLTSEELRELCDKTGRALYAAHTAAIAPGQSLAEWNARRDVHADLMRIQPDLWHACRRHEHGATPDAEGAKA